MGRQWSDGYSSQVEIYLVHDARRFEIAQIGPGWFIFREPTDLPQVLARIIIKVDKHERELEVILYEGATAGDPMVRYEKRAFYAGIDFMPQPAR